ncbi:pentulose/hexulose kinase [Saccharomonospora marina XMU15]|uniref:Pentulose/hexulose kinase n=1 Tax=Saccharomonospora marina XMU15 TaxID=882083 RepID=H5WZG4_9PSEU|nr:FGGY family carbohydrate kinase [Saccharomonospora marina]EHR49626.1 pentulose/hexulose kinase [Saccharomonospora marina XMU15]
MPTTRDCVVGIDVGTTSAKAVVIDDRSRVLGEAAQEYPTRYVGPSGAEQDPRHWWKASCRCVRAALDAAGVPATAVAAVAVSSQAPSVVALDARRQPLGPALLWLDRRGEQACRDRAAEGDRVVAVTGNRLDPYYAAPKLAWLLDNQPGLRSLVDSVVFAAGYVVHELTGVLCADTGHAGLSLLYDLRAGRWSEELARLWNLRSGWLPPLADPTEVVGSVRAEAAEATGLPRGTPVVAGLVDGAAASLESGVVAHGDVCEMTGQSTVVNAAVEASQASGLTGSLSVMPYVVPGRHLVFGSMVATGGILAWFRSRLGRGETFADLDELAATARPGAGGVLLLPYFLGERSPVWDSDARGAFVGMSLGTTRADLVRAILEGSAYGLAHNLAELASLGLRPPALRVVGGGARGRTWNRIKADVTGLAVELPRQSAGAPVGAALAAASGVGLVDDLADAARERFSVAERIEPDPDRHADYQRRYRVYRELHPALRTVHSMLAELRDADLTSADGGGS